MQSLKQQFVEWVGKQDPGATFRPCRPKECAGFQFLTAYGYPVRECLVGTWDDVDGEVHDLPEEISAAIGWACEHVGWCNLAGTVTFGALADRLSRIGQ